MAEPTDKEEGLLLKERRGARKKWQSLAVLYIRNRKNMTLHHVKKGEKKKRKTFLIGIGFLGDFFRTNGIVENRVS